MASYQAQHIQFENWSPQEVANWLQGLDESVAQYVPLFKVKCVDGRKLLMLNHSDLEKMGIHKLGHQELVLEAVDLLRSLRYTLDTENLQSMALQLGCKARNVVAEIQMRQGENDQNRANMRHAECLHRKRLSITVLSYVADMLATLKNLVSWLDRAPFEGIYDICRLRNSVVKLGLELVMVTQRESSYVDPEEAIMKSCRTLIEYCDGLVQNTKDPLVIQPAALEQATIRKKQGEELGMNIQSAYNGIHGISSIKDLSPADMCSKIEKGDEVLQVNGQTVLGWQLKELVKILKDKPKEVTLLLKKRPRHINPLGAMQNHKKLAVKHVPQPSTLPKSLKKRRSREGEVKQARPSLQEFVSVASSATDDIYVTKDTPDTNDGDGNDTDNDVFRSGSESPQYTLPVMPDAKQRRATVSGGSPTFERNSLMVEDPVIRPKSQVIKKGEREAALAVLAASENNLKSRVTEGSTGTEEGGHRNTDSVWRKTSSESSSGHKGPSESEMEDSVFSSDKEDKDQLNPKKTAAEKKRQEFRVTKPTPMLLEPCTADMATQQKSPVKRTSSSSSSSISSNTSSSTLINSPNSSTQMRTGNSDSNSIPQIRKTRVLEAALKWGDQSGIVVGRKPSIPKSPLTAEKKPGGLFRVASVGSGSQCKTGKSCEKKLSLSHEHENQLSMSQKCEVKSSISQDCDSKTALTQNCEKDSSQSQDCEKKVSVSLDSVKQMFEDCERRTVSQNCEKPPSMVQDCKKPPSMVQDCEKPPSMVQDYKKPPSMVQDCEKPPSMTDCKKPPSMIDCEKPPSMTQDCEKPPSMTDCEKPPIMTQDCEKPPSMTDCEKPPSMTQDCEKPPIMTQDCEKLPSMAHACEDNTSMSHIDEKNANMSQNGEKNTSLPQDCQENTSMSENGKENANLSQNSKENTSLSQDCQETASLSVIGEKNTSLSENLEENINMPLNGERSTSVTQDCEKNIRMSEDCEKGPFVPGHCEETLDWQNCEEKGNISHDCDKTLTVSQDIEEKTDTLRTSVTVPTTPGSSTSSVVDTVAVPASIAGTSESAGDSALEMDKKPEQSEENTESQNSNVQCDDDSTTRSSHCADSVQSVSDVMPVEESTPGMLETGRDQPDHRPQSVQQAVYTEVATDVQDKDAPHLVKVKKLDSMQTSETESTLNKEPDHSKQKKRVEFSKDAKQSSSRHENSFTHIVIGGVVQKIPTEKAQASGGDSPPVKMRHKSVRKHLDRRVSCKDLGKGDCEGWLYKRKEKDRTLSKNWSKRWFVLKNCNLYCYKNKDDLKAEGIVYMPAFLVSPAPDLKTKKFAFKVHNSGTTFYFASERQDDMSKWMNKMGLAAISFDTSNTITTGGFMKPEPRSHQPDVCYSESDEETEEGSAHADGKDAVSIASSLGSQSSLQSSPPALRNKAHADHGSIKETALEHDPSLVASQGQAASPGEATTSQTEEQTGAEDSPHKTDELHKTLTALRSQDLTFDGVDRRKRRTQHMSTLLGANDGKDDEQMAQLRKLLALKRTLKTKEQELQDIDRLLASQLTPGRLRDFVYHHPLMKL